MLAAGTLLVLIYRERTRIRLALHHAEHRRSINNVVVLAVSLIIAIMIVPPG